MKSRLFACVIIFLAIQMSAFAAAVRLVPTRQYPNIQSAVTACVDGDMVVVQRISANGGNNYTVPGTTPGNPGGGITIPAGVANLTIRSYNPKDPACVADTVIDCGNSGRAFNFVDDQECHVIIEGFTIINGRITGRVGADGDLTGVDPANPDPEMWSGEDVQGDGYGGAIYIGSANTPGVSISPVIRNCVIQNCHVYGAVGGRGADGFVIYSMDPNNPGEITIEDTLPGGQGGDGDGNGLGAAIYCGQSSTPTIVNCVFSNNFGHGGIGGIGGDGLAATLQYEIQATDGGDGGEGIGDGHGGAIYADQLSDPNILRCTFTSNTVTVGIAGQGGPMGNSNAYPDNPAFNGSQGGVTTNNMSDGGAVYYNTQSSNNLNLSTFEHNNADDSGGAIYCASGSILNINAGCVFNHNQALGGSGGALAAEALCIFDINDTKFLSNYAWFDGGAINTGAGCDIHISNSSLNANTAGVDDGTNFTWGDGGAISTIDGTVLEINLCSFGLNKATQYGGAVSAIGVAQYCKAAMYSTSVISNQSLLGGGIYFDKFQPTDPSVENPTPDLLANCTFISNLSEYAGGGIYLVDNSVGLGSRIVDCDITDNSVFGGYASGGGAYLNSVESTFENCRILRNSSSGSGGSIYFIAPYNTEVKNCLFVDNSAVNDGSVISSNFNINNSVVKFTNNTFSKNTITSPVGEGGAVYNNGFCNPVINDCIFYQCNKAAVYESDETSQSILKNNLFYSNPNGDYRVYTLGGAVVYTGAVAINTLPNDSNNIDDNPMFVSGDLGDYYLSQIAAGQFQNSKAVDAGSTSAVLAGLDKYTTRTDSLANPDEANDVNAVDLGYHYRKTADMPVYHLTIEIVNPYGTVTTMPVMENNDFYAGTVVTLIAKPNFSYRVAYWEGTESDSSTALTNTVIMNSDKTVRIQFETPKVLKVKSDGGSGFYSDIRDALFDAQDGDVIEIYKGVYRGPVIELYKNVYIRSRNPNDPLYVADTIIDLAGYRDRAFYISNIIDSSTVIDGLTMINAGWTWANGPDGFRAPYFAPNGGDGSPFQGGCIYIDAGASPIIKNCIIRDNYGQAGGGGNGVGAQEDPAFNAGRGGWGGWSRGGAVYCGTGSAPQFVNCKFQNNEAIGGSGGNGGNAARGVAGNYGGNWSTFRSPEFPNIDPRIGGIRVIDTVPDIELWDIWGQMANSDTDPYGLSGTLHPSGYQIDNIGYDGYYGDYKWYGGYGGAVYCGLNSDVNFINCEITGNSVVSGMSGLGGSQGSKLCEPQISYELPSFGAGVYCDANSNTLFDGCTISNNVASQMQGRYRLSPIVSHGGGVCSEDTASVIFRNCHISENQADIGGGIHFADSNPLIEDSNFVGNIAMQGGGIYGDHGVADIVDCNIIGNQARSFTDGNNVYIIDGAGAGIHISSLDVNIVDCLISENLAEYSGGGLFFDGGEFQSVINCLITDNLAGHDGGGIAVTMWSEPTISNCTIVGNQLESDPNVFGAGVDVSNGGSAIIVNSIIWDNNGVQISVGVEEEPSSAYVTYSDIGPGDVPVYAAPNCFVQGWDPNLYPDSNGWAPDTNNINQDPLFLSDYLLTQIKAGQLVDSPAVDTGSDLASVLGFEGYTTRTDSGPDEDIVDMGYHHPMFLANSMELNFTAITDPDLGVEPVIDPCGITYYTQYTTVTLTVSDPPANYQVEWSGSDDDSLLTTTNTIHMNTNKIVVAGFVKNYCVLNVNVVGNGGFEVSPEPDANGVYLRDTVVTITAVPDAGYRVKRWTGTADDTSVALKNTVVMDGDKTVTVEFEQPRIISVPGGDAGSLQAAIDNARELDTIKLASGTYRMQQGFDIYGKNIIIQSSNPDDPNIVAGTIIERLSVPGGSHSGAFTFRDVGPQAVLNGITIRNFSIRTTNGDDGDNDPNTFVNMCGRNSGTSAGVAIVCSKASPTIKNCRFENCSTFGGNGGNGAAGDEAQPNGGMGGWPGGAHGGAVAMYIGWDMAGEKLGPSNPTFINCDFIGNSAQGGNGGNGGDGLTDDTNYIYGAPGLGGGWYYGEPGSYYYGTRIYWPFGYHFDGRGSDGQYDEYTRYSGLGGAVFVGPNCNPVFKGCNFEGNRSYGGFCGINGLHGGVDLRMAPAAPLKIDSLGGAVYCDSNSAPYFYDCNFVDNEADANIPADNDKPFISYGGGVAARDDAKPVFEKCSFSNNFATIGGGLYCGNIDAKIIDCNFVGNSAFHGGGLYYSDGDSLVKNSTFVYNFTTQPPDPNIFPDEIFGTGGGMYITTSSAMIVDCNISMNRTGASGGGLYLSNATSTLKNCLVTSNESGRDGGGVSLNWVSQLDVSNCTFADNMTTGISFPSPYNYGGGLYCGYGSDANIINSIFWGNTAGSGGQLAVSAEHVEDANTIGSTLGVSYSIVLGGKTAVFVANKCVLTWGAGNLNLNPLLVSGLRGDYFLSNKGTNDPNQIADSNSPAINAGSGSAVDFGLSAYTTRTDGRYDQGVVDMGYHYRIGGECQICDLDNSGKVEFGDLAILAQYWLYSDTECTFSNNWCQGANLVIDDQVDFKDYSRIVQCWMATTTDMKAQWLRDPYARLPKFSIGMSARPVINSWGWDVEYYFQCLEDAGADSGWQEESEYTATGLQSNTIYSFRFKVRDISPNQTESEWSEVKSVFSGSPDSDLTAPTPDPMTWEIVPTMAGPNSIIMRASLAVDDVIGNDVQYMFISLDSNGTSSNWQDGQDYVDDTVGPNTVCTYQVIARDVPAQNETARSVAKSATTGVVDNMPPLPNPSLWAVGGMPYEGGGYHAMEAVQASDDLTGGNNPVWYYFEGSDGGLSSGWRNGDLQYLIPGTTVMIDAWRYVYPKTGNCIYKVYTCDSIPGSNPPQPNTANTTTASVPGGTY